MTRFEQDSNPIMKTIRLVMLLAAAILTSACTDGDLSDLENWVKKEKARDDSKIEPLPPIKTVERFVLDPSDLRNPFAPTESPDQPEPVVATNGVRPDAIRPREELESYALDSLRMVGTVTMAANLWGLVQANDGTIHRVQNGNYMGQNHGKIVLILENQIKLMEIIPDAPGAWREREAAVKLSE